MPAAVNFSRTGKCSLCGVETTMMLRWLRVLRAQEEGGFCFLKRLKTAESFGDLIGSMGHLISRAAVNG